MIPLRQGFLVDGTDIGEALIGKIPDEGTGDEAARARDDDQIIFLQCCGGSCIFVHVISFKLLW